MIQPIVAGVHGSQSVQPGGAALAARQAELTHAELHAVMAWTLPEIYSYTPRDFEGETREALEGAIEQALGPEPRVPLTAQVVQGHAAGALIDASRDAQLLRRQPRRRWIHRHAPRLGKLLATSACVKPRARRAVSSSLTGRTRVLVVPTPECRPRAPDLRFQMQFSGHIGDTLQFLKPSARRKTPR